MKIKVCGMRETDNLRAVEQLDIDWMGFIFYPCSPRYVSAETADATAIRRCRRTKVGVFVNAGADEIDAAQALYALECVQLHGNESPSDCAALQRKGLCVIKAFAIATADDLRQTDAYASCADYFLFDTKCDAYGGSGRRFDWSVLKHYHGHTPFLLSGGLAPACIEDLLRFDHPTLAGIDLNSGFETAPALKDVDALNRFIRKIKQNE